MIAWRDYLTMLCEDGVELARSEDESLDADGHRIENLTLVRYLDGRLLFQELPPIEDTDEPVRPYLQRQIMNTLRLPPERYAFGRL